MKYKQLGKTNIETSVIGFGTWGLGGVAYGPLEESVSIKLLCRALDLGVTFYDTSDLYGAGKSEELLRKAFAKNREKVIYATKGGTLPHTGFVMPQDFSRGYLTTALEGSLKRLNTDYVDLYQLHSPTLKDIEQHDCIATLEQFKKDGKIKEYGVSVRSPMDAIVAIEVFGFKSIQVNFNVIDQRAAECGLFDTAIKHGAGLICRTPLCFGFLSGELGTKGFADGDHRANWPEDQLRTWADAPALFNAVAKSYGLSYIQMALLFCLSQEAISTVIPGIMSMAELEEDIGVVEHQPLTTEALKSIINIYQANVFFNNDAKKRGKQ